MEVWLAPRDNWLVLMADGWCLPNPLELPRLYGGHDAHYRTVLVRAVR